MFFCEFCKIFKNIFWQDTSGWLLLVCNCEFWEVVQITSFIEYLWETSYFKYKLLDFNHQIQEKSISQVLFKHFIQEQEVASYSKARSSHQRCSIKKGVLRETPVPESLYNKVAGLRPAILLKKRLRHWCFHVNFTKFLRTTFLQNTLGRLLLEGVHLLKIPENYLWRS